MLLVLINLLLRILQHLLLLFDLDLRLLWLGHVIHRANVLHLALLASLLLLLEIIDHNFRRVLKLERLDLILFESMFY